MILSFAFFIINETDGWKFDMEPVTKEKRGLASFSPQPEGNQRGVLNTISSIYIRINCSTQSIVSNFKDQN